MPGKPYDVVAVPEECPHGVTNSCQVIIVLMDMVIMICEKGDHCLNENGDCDLDP